MLINRKLKSWTAGLVIWLVAISAATAQDTFTQLGCQVIVRREGDYVIASGLIQASKPTRADYQLRALKIDATNSGTLEQSGSHNLQPGEPQETSRMTIKMAPTGWVEFHLQVSERLTGATCEADEIVSPM